MCTKEIEGTTYVKRIQQSSHNFPPQEAFHRRKKFLHSDETGIAMHNNLLRAKSRYSRVLRLDLLFSSCPESSKIWKKKNGNQKLRQQSKNKLLLKMTTLYKWSLKKVKSIRESKQLMYIDTKTDLKNVTLHKIHNEGDSLEQNMEVRNMRKKTKLNFLYNQSNLQAKKVVC